MRDAAADQRAASALAYADDLVLESQGRELSGAARGLVGRVDNGAGKLRSAQADWKAASTGLTGTMAVTLGIATPAP